MLFDTRVVQIVVLLEVALRGLEIRRGDVGLRIV
jgi:hypothetical protein